MRLGSRHVKTRLFKSSASLCRVTSPDQYFRLALAVARFAFGAMAGPLAPSLAVRRRRRGGPRRRVAARNALPRRRLADLLPDLASEVLRFSVLVGAAEPLRFVDLDAQRGFRRGLRMRREHGLHRVDLILAASLGAAALAKRSIMLSSIAAVKTIAAGPFVPPRRNANRRYQTACDTLAALGGTLRGFHRHAGPTGPSHRRHGGAGGWAEDAGVDRLVEPGADAFSPPSVVSALRSSWRRHAQRRRTTRRSRCRPSTRSPSPRGAWTPRVRRSSRASAPRPTPSPRRPSSASPAATTTR